jgi:hypothetical protein
MRMFQRPIIAFVVAALLVSVPVAAAAQSQAQKPASKADQKPKDPVLPVDVEKIKKALEKPDVLVLDDSQLRFYATVTAKVPSFEDFVGDFDLRNGPVPRAGMTHQEFLNMVTPKELYSSAGITAPEMLQFAITNWAAQQVIKKGLQEIRQARTEREIRAIRDRINRELAALAGNKDQRN